MNFNNHNSGLVIDIDSLYRHFRKLGRVVAVKKAEAAEKQIGRQVEKLKRSVESQPK